MPLTLPLHQQENIKRSEDKIKDLPEGEQATTTVINADERSKINTKPITSAVYEELKQIHECLKKVADLEDKRLEEEKAESETKFNNAVAESREEGRKAGVEEATAKIFTVVRFLRLAGYRRQVKSGNDQEDEAIERLLVLVYGGDQTAVDACLKLANGSEDIIDEFGVTCMILHLSTDPLLLLRFIVFLTNNFFRRPNQRNCPRP